MNEESEAASMGDRTPCISSKLKEEDDYLMTTVTLVIGVALQNGMESYISKQLNHRGTKCGFFNFND